MTTFAIIAFALLMTSCSTEPAPLDGPPLTTTSSVQGGSQLTAQQAQAVEPLATIQNPVTPTASATIAPTETPTAEPELTATPIPPTATPEPTSTPVPELEPTPTEVVEPTVELVTEIDDEHTEGADVILNGDPAWEDAIETTDGAHMGMVTATELNIRAEPRLDAEILNTTFQRHTVSVYELVSNADGQWYRVGDGRYVSSAFVAPFSAPAPEETYEGHWIDVNLSSFYAIAYNGDTPVYSAIITAGRDERTPLGVYNVFYRVRSETMDSATVGLPEGHPEHYYLEDVEFTQYFKEGGFAIHGNYWTDPAEFGAFSSNGCVGLMNPDAAWFWDFLSVGSVVSIHY